MQTLNLKLKPEAKSDLPVKAIQFGEGNFLRGFLDWMLFKLNTQHLFNGRVLAVQPTPNGRVQPKLQNQDSLYTTILHGVVEGQDCEVIDIVNTIADCLNPYDDEQWQKLKQVACDLNVQFVFSNTTEAGISYVKEDILGTKAPTSFPAKLTAILYERFKAHKGTDCACGSGITIMPCELLDDNGTKLKNIVLKHCDDCNLGDEFKAYITEDCTFLNTLVDRVVSGFPKDNKEECEQKLGYVDELMTCGEIFHFLAIEGDDSVKELLPFEKAGLNVVVASDITPYRLRKVRILNGAHTSNVPAAYLAGLETVYDMMIDKVTGPFVRSVIYDEIIPAVKLEKQMLTSFADDVVNRFLDPTMHHQLASILMNCTSKVKARILPTILDARSQGILPTKLCFAFAAYIALYKDANSTLPVAVKREGGKCGEFNDDKYAVESLSKAWSYYKKSETTALMVVKAVLSDENIWGRNLSSDVDLTALIAKLLHAIISDGVKATMLDIQD